jgi:hypothetical protein
MKEFSSESGRIGLPSMPRLRYMALLDFLRDNYPDWLKQSLVERIRVGRPELYEQIQQEEQLLKQQ